MLLSSNIIIIKFNVLTIHENKYQLKACQSENLTNEALTQNNTLNKINCRLKDAKMPRSITFVYY